MTGRAPERGSPATMLRCGSKSARTLSNEEEAITEDWTVHLPDQLEALKTRSSLPELDQEDGPVRRQVALEPSENRVRTPMCACWPSAAAAIGEALKLGFPRHSSPEPAVGRPGSQDSGYSGSPARRRPCRRSSRSSSRSKRMVERMKPDTEKSLFAARTFAASTAASALRPSLPKDAAARNDHPPW